MNFCYHLLFFFIKSLRTLIFRYHFQNQHLIKTLSNHTSWISWGLDLSADGQTLISCSGDQTIKFWHWPTGQCLNTINAGVSAWSLSILNTENIVSQNGILTVLFN